jgi:hypothetical protein
MHDALIVIYLTTGINFDRILFNKVVLIFIVNIVPDDINVFVSIRPGMFMPVSNSMTNFMDYYSFCIATGPYGYPLPSSPKTHKGTASAMTIPLYSMQAITQHAPHTHRCPYRKKHSFCHCLFWV